MYVMKSKFARFLIFNGPMAQEKRDMMRQRIMWHLGFKDWDFGNGNDDEWFDEERFKGWFCWRGWQRDEDHRLIQFKSQGGG